MPASAPDAMGRTVLAGLGPVNARATAADDLLHSIRAPRPVPHLSPRDRVEREPAPAFLLRAVPPARPRSLGRRAVSHPGRAGAVRGGAPDGRPGAGPVLVPIHPTAVVDPRAEIDATADIGPYAV